MTDEEQERLRDLGDELSDDARRERLGDEDAL